MYEIEKSLVDAQKVLMPYWPLTSFIATNHLWEYRNKNFFELEEELKFNYFHLQDENETIDISQPKMSLYAEEIDDYKFKTLESFISEKIFTILLSYYNKSNTKNFIETWVLYDQSNQFKISNFNNIPLSIENLCCTLSIPEEFRAHYFKKIYFKIYGFASFSKWLNCHPDNPWITKKSVLNEIILIWLFYENIARQKTKIKPHFYIQNMDLSSINKHRNNQKKLEKSFQDKVKDLIKPTKLSGYKQPKAQFVFCIDTRSEGLRRHLELINNYQTFGSAGFFGVYFKLTERSEVFYQSPALLKPLKVISRKIINQPKLKNIVETVFSFRQKILNLRYAPLALFEIIGIWYLLKMAIKTFLPLLIKNKTNPPFHIIINSYSLKEKITSSAAFLKSIDLTENFSSTVIICGHQTDVTNNPFASALNCGACGGNSGVANTEVICQFLNDPEVRNGISKSANIAIPNDTHFLAACHHTVNDRITFLSKKPEIDIINDIQKASMALNLEKESNYPFLSTHFSNETNWSELVPELALVNNAAFIIGPRELTDKTNLERRSFLQSYNFKKDLNAEILTSIFSGPCIVAHWINMQYYLSTKYPAIFGAGNKAIHNVIPNIGVIEGNLSDLKIGLPLQSIYFQDKQLHEPVRLSYFVHATALQIEKALNNTPDFALLVKNEWVNLFRFDDETNEYYHY